MVQINSLAAFRRFLATPGATVQITRHDWADNTRLGLPPKPGFMDPRKVKKLQTNAVCFDFGDRGTWLYWDRGNSKAFRFDNTDMVTVVLDAEKSEIMQYRCTIEQ